MSLSGIILRVTPYQEKGLILLIFTQEEGLLPCFVSMTKREPYTWVEPFIEVRGKKGDRKGKLVQLKELVGERWFWGLRERPESVKTLYSMRTHLLKIMEEEEPLPLVYLLFQKIMEGLEKGLNPKTMEALFVVKLALHEGILDLESVPVEYRDWVKQAAAARTLADPFLDLTGNQERFPAFLLEAFLAETCLLHEQDATSALQARYLKKSS